jgi:hypothetical protein
MGTGWFCCQDKSDSIKSGRARIISGLHIIVTFTNNLYILAFTSIDAQENKGMFEEFDQIKKNIEIANWIRLFCEDRFAQISRNDGDPKPGRIIMHMIPFESLDPMKHIEMKLAVEGLQKIGKHPKYNSKGLICSLTDEYLQLFRNGTMEYAMTSSDGDISGSGLKANLTSELDTCLKVARTVKIEPPVFVEISLLNANDIFADFPGFHDRGHKIGAEKLVLIPILIDNLEVGAESILQRALDEIWHAAGIAEQPHT